MKKILVCFLTLISLAANAQAKNEGSIGIGLSTTTFKLSSLNNDSITKFNKFPLELYAGTKINIGQDLNFILKTTYTFAYSKANFDNKKFTINEHTLGLGMGLEYDMIKLQNFNIGLAVGVGYEYNLLRIFKSDGEFVPNFNYGIYTTYNDSHKLGLNFAQKNYKNNKTITKDNSTYKIERDEFISTLYYSYSF